MERAKMYASRFTRCFHPVALVALLLALSPVCVDAGITLISRKTNVSGFANTLGASGQGEPPGQQETTFDPADLTERNSASSDPGGSASGMMHVTSQIVVNGGARTLRVTGTGSSDGHASVTDPAFSANSSSNGEVVDLVFELTGGAYKFAVTGQAATSLDPIGLATRNNNVCALRIISIPDHGSGTEYYNVLVGPNGDGSFAGGGTIPAGAGRLFLRAWTVSDVRAGRIIGTQLNNPSDVNGSNSFDFDITFTPTTQPTPTPTPTPTPGATPIRWTNTAGGAFGTSTNWNPQTVPTSTHTAIFDPGATYTVDIGTAATDRLVIRNGFVTFVNTNYNVGSSAFDPASLVINNGELKLASGALHSVHALIGESSGLSQLSILFGATSESSGDLQVGGPGHGTLVVVDGGTVTSAESRIATTASGGDAFVIGRTATWTTGDLAVGFNGTGSLHIEQGALVRTGSDVGSVGFFPGASGEVTVSGMDGNQPSRLVGDIEVDVGDGGMGSASILDGGKFEPLVLVIGKQPGANGSVKISGVNSTASAVRTSSFLSVSGRTSVNGSLLIEQGARSDHHSTPVFIGDDFIGGATISGFDVASGFKSQMQNVSDFTVGNKGIGSLEIKDGAAASGFDANLGLHTLGEVFVRGSGNNSVSTWELMGTLTVGKSHLGTLRVSEGGSVSANQVVLGAKVDSAGEVTVSGRSALGPSLLLVSNGLTVGNKGQGSLKVDTGGRVDVTSTLSMAGQANAASSEIRVGGKDPTTGIGAALNVDGNVFIGADFDSGFGALVVTEEGTASCQDMTLGAFPGTVASLLVGAVGGTGAPARFTASGDLHVGNPGLGLVHLENGGIVTVSGNLFVNSFGTVEGNGTLAAPPARRILNGGTIQPGLSPGLLTFDANFEQTGTLRMEAAGLADGQFDVLHVTGNTTLGGTMQVTFLNGYLPKTGDVLPFLKLDGTVTGDFAQITFPQLKSGFQVKREMVNGSYKLTALNDAVLAPTSVLNISTRLQVGTDDRVLIGGFILQGAGAKKVMVRAIGPSLTSAGVAGALSDPTLELHDSSGAIIATNNNWNVTQVGGVITANQVGDIQASTIAPTNTRESAIIGTLTPGAYTAIIRGANNTTGVALAEVYDLSQAVPARLANISTRGFVQTGDQVMIGGFIIGNQTTKVVVRAIGPSLTSAGVPGALADPVLELHNGQGGLIFENDNWKDTQKADLEATTIPPNNDLESAIVATLPPGNYTAIVRGKNNTAGVGLVEIYNIP